MLWIMFFIGIAGILIFFVSIVLEIFSSYRDWDDIKTCSIKMLICIVLFIVSLLGFAGIINLSYNEVLQTGYFELVSIADNSQVSGKGNGGLFYVHVDIETDEVYSFYYKIANDGIKRGRVDVDATTLYEKDDCTPHIVEYTTYTKNKMNKILRCILAFGYGESSEKTYEIYTPEGTILRTFNLGL